MGYSTFTKLYESCVCPIMEYSSGVWGYDQYNKLDTIQNRASRVFLGVHRFAPLLALEGDMGWMSTRYRRWINILRLWNRLTTLNMDRITNHVFINDFYLAQSGDDNLCANVYRIFSCINEEDLFYNRVPCDIYSVANKLMHLQEEKWKNALISKPKLRFYRKFKSCLEVEKYVKYNLTSSQRSVTAQFRAGILPLHIETGRFRNTKLEDRICTLCNMNDVESEIHFLFDCPCYVNIRQTWLEHIFECCCKFNNLIVEEKLRLLFDQFHRCTAKFILNCFKIRKELLFQ